VYGGGTTCGTKKKKISVVVRGVTIDNGPCATPMGGLTTESCVRSKVRSSGDGGQSWHPPHP
jgi:hypothetical protein